MWCRFSLGCYKLYMDICIRYICIFIFELYVHLTGIACISEKVRYGPSQVQPRVSCSTPIIMMQNDSEFIRSSNAFPSIGASAFNIIEYSSYDSIRLPVQLETETPLRLHKCRVHAIAAGGPRPNAN